MDFTPLQMFMQYMAKERTPGNAVEVYLHGKKVFCFSSGFSNWENKIPLQGNELYNIYSCTKLATVVAGLQLLERGKIKLDDPLYAYFPEFERMYVQKDGYIRKANTPITLRHLFTMTAGFTYNRNTEGFKTANALTNGRMGTLTTIRCIATDPLSFEPGTHWQYSLCHDVLAAVIEYVSGMRFSDYVQSNLFSPLQMDSCTFHHTPKTIQNTAEQYKSCSAVTQDMDFVEAQQIGCDNIGFYKNVGKKNDLVFGPDYDSGGAGIISNLSDYAKLTAALANYGMGLTGEQILTKESVELMRKNTLNQTQLMDLHKWPQLLGCGYGLGVRTHMDAKESKLKCNLGEFGWGGAAGATAIIDPKIGLGVFYVQHLLNPREEYYQPKLRDIVYQCL